MTYRYPVVTTGDDTYDPSASKVGSFGQHQSGKWYDPIIEILLVVGAALLIAFVVKTLVAQAFFIPSESMRDQLEIGDRVVVSKLAYRLHEPRRGDIVVFDAPPGLQTNRQLEETPPSPFVRFLQSLAEMVGLHQPSTQEFIKRVVALPGERVEGRNGKVLVDGQELVEPYLAPGVITHDFQPVIVPEGHLWVMGDNRTRSMDSRSSAVGPIRRDLVVGRAVVRAWPVDRAAFL